jgi:YVTN family beta-propeller protein
MRRFRVALLPIAFLLGVGVCLGASDVLTIHSVVCTGSWKFDTTGIGQYGCAGAFDGITTDSTSGGPTGNATFWLGREQQDNETLTFDLGGIFSISSVDLYNTHNGINNDRGTVNFKIWVSSSPQTPDNTPGSSFGTLVLSNTLAVSTTDPNPRQSFSFSPTLGRYVTFRAENWVFNSVHGDGGTGLSEIVLHGRVAPMVYVANAGSHSVSVIDPATNTVVATVPVGSNPVYTAVTPDGTKAYVTNAGAKSVSVIDPSTNSVAATVPVGSNPVNVAVH